MIKPIALSALLFLTSLGGCAATGKPAAGSLANAGIAATSWRLVAFQSMDDSQGTIEPVKGKTYTLDFNANGSVTLQLDCNRGNASYSEGIANATGGSLTISPVAATRALCPPPDMGEMLVARLPDVASYTLRDGHLFLSLKMDGGIIEFAPN